MKNRVWKCNSEGIASLMSGNERIRRPSSVNSRIPTCAPCEFKGDWGWILYSLCWGCTLVYRLYIMARLKWQQKCANAADRGDRVQSVRNRVYSITYRSSISVQFVGVQFFLLRVNRACKTNTSMTVDNNLHKLLEAAVVELSRLRVDRHRVRLVAVGGEVEESSAVVRASEERMVERGVASSVRELLQRVVGGNREPFGVGRMLWPFSSAMKGYLSLQTVTSCSSSRNRCTLGSSRLATGWPR